MESVIDAGNHLVHNKINYKLKSQEGNGNAEIFSVFPGAEIGTIEFGKSDMHFKHVSMGNVMQINLCLQGRMEWKLHNGECIYLGPGDISMHMMDQCAVSAMNLPLEFYKGIIILIDLNKFESHLTEAIKTAGGSLKEIKTRFCQGGQTTVLPATDETSGMFVSLKTISSKYQLAYWQIKIQETLLYLQRQEVSKSVHETYPSMTVDIIKKIQKQLVDHLGERQTIEDLSKEFLMNTTTLKKVFKTVYGQPIAQYMKDYRIRYGANLLCRTTQTVGEIADTVGYESQSKFSAAFKEIMQISPLDYRRRYQVQEHDKTV